MTNNDIAKVLLAVGAVSPKLASALLVNLSTPVVKAVAVPAVKAVAKKPVVKVMSGDPVEFLTGLNKGDWFMGMYQCAVDPKTGIRPEPELKVRQLVYKLDSYSTSVWCFSARNGRTFKTKLSSWTPVAKA